MGKMHQHRRAFALRQSSKVKFKSALIELYLN
jgi:hypothetical protein